MKILVNYADAAYRKAQTWNTWTGKHIGGFDRVVEFSPKDIDDEYRTAHREIFNIKRGNGCWLWKPYIIRKTLEQCQDGDVIFYCDSGAFFVKKIDQLIVSMRPDEKIWVSDNPLLESCFTKPICFEKMGCDTKEIRESNQIQATYFMLVCCAETRAFVEEWLHYCESYELMSPEGGLLLKEQRENRFVAHREDQSILSLLCKRKGIRSHRDPSQRGKIPETFYNPYYAYRVPNHVDDKYGTVIFLHKNGRLSFLGFMRLIYIEQRCKYRYFTRGKRK